MQKRIVWMTGLFMWTIVVTSQSLTILDADTKEPVSDVYVFNETQSLTRFSNTNGEIDIEGFKSEDILFFQHPAYENERLSFERLQKDKLRLQLTEKIVTFKEVVIAANKWEQDASEVSQDILSLDRKSIGFQNPQTSADLLENSGQVFVQKSQYGGGSPTLRGFAANKVLLVVDGVRMNNAIYRSGNLQNVINIDPNAVNTTEVVFGPGSVMYGSDALGGVMDFQMKRPVFSSSQNTLVSGAFLSRVGTSANERTFHADLGIGKNRLAYWGSFSFSDFDDLRSGSNRSDGYEGHFLRHVYAQRIDGVDQLVDNKDPDLQKFSGYQVFNSIHKISFRLNDRSDLTYGFYHSATGDIPRYDRLTIPLNDDSDSLEYAEWYYEPQKWNMHHLNYGYFGATGFFDQMKVSLSFQDYTESRNDRSFGFDALRKRRENLDIFTGSIDFEKVISARTTLFYGIDGFYNYVRSRGNVIDIETGERTSSPTRYPDEGSQFYSLANYYSLRHKISAKWNLNLGLRYNGVWLKAQTSDENASLFTFSDVDIFNQALTGSIGSVFLPNDRSKISLVLASGFRAPNVDDVGKIFELDDETIVVPNPELKPEYVYSQELGYQMNVNEVTQIDFVVYHSLLTNAIVRGVYGLDNDELASVESAFAQQDRQLSASDIQVRAQVNSDRARLYGGSARIKSKLLDHLALISSISINEGKDLNTDESLRHATPVFGQTQVKFQKDRWSISAISDYHFSREQDQIPDSEIVDKPHLYTDEGSPGWITLDVRGSVNFKNGIGVEGGLENVFDQHYRPYSSGISAPGRNLYLTAKFNF